MTDYRYRETSWFKKISENKAKRLKKMKIRVFEKKQSKTTFWIPVAWYDRFSGEEVEPFDTVRGLEEYNHDFER